MVATYLRYYEGRSESKERFAIQIYLLILGTKLISRNVKLQLYNTLMRPIVTYASETWVLKENMINKLLIVERKITRKILGPIRSDDGHWRIKTNQEISDILKGQNIIRFIKKTKTEMVGPCGTHD